MLSLPVKVVLYVCLGYLSGNIMYAYWVPKLLKGVDVRDYGADHNPGAANATLACGLPMGILCAMLDILKGTVPVTLALHVSDITGWALVPIVLAPVVGHAWPLLIPGKGGKAIAASFGVFIGLMPEILLAVLWAALLLICLPFIKEHRELILITSALLAMLTFVIYPMPSVRTMSCGVSGILMYKHRPIKEKTPEAVALPTAHKNRKGSCS